MTQQIRTAWIFPGQSAQAPGMGADIAEHSRAARAVFDQADKQLGFALSELCFNGPADTLTATENAQPALLTVSTALLAAAAELNRNVLSMPAFMAGHSLGEYSALVAAGVLSFGDALRLVRRRGELMAQASEGSMAAIIGLELDSLQQVCRAASDDGVVVVANENSPGQLVISGSSAAVQRAMVLARERGAKRAIALNVGAAFHSPLMEQAAHGLRQAVGEVEAFGPAITTIISNVTAEPLGGAVADELVAQVTAPVRWIASVQYMVDAGVSRFVEIGPGNVLAGLVKRIAPGAEVVGVSDWESLVQWIDTIREDRVPTIVGADATNAKEE